MLLPAGTTLLVVVVLPVVAAVDGDGARLRGGGGGGTVAGASEETGPWRRDLPWRELRRRLAEPSSLVDADVGKYVAECVPEFERPGGQGGDRTNWALIDKPSGLCLDQLFCAFDDCDPKPDAADDPLLERLLGIGAIGGADFAGGTYSSMAGDEGDAYRSWIEDPSNPRSALPGKVLHPRVASDVIAAVDFANEHGLEVSVKNSGHSYTASSTKADTLLLNMRRYAGYAPDGIVECDDAGRARDGGDPGDLSDQPCSLALARGKPGVVRVGGGENWGEVYSAVREYNVKEYPDDFKFHVVGGGATTVSPNGWTFEGGKVPTTGGRLLGNGVDQVLQIEMVLPSGEHVKFGPTDWDIPDGAKTPRTLAVSGVCRANPDEPDEREWAWGECPDDVPFDDLWFAVRGGGGGTWGVVLSMHLQLHDYPGRLHGVATPLFPALSWCQQGHDPTEEQLGALASEYRRYLTRFLLDPKSLGIDERDSYGCGSAQPYVFSCYGESSARALIDGWDDYVRTVAVAGRLKNDLGMTDDQMDSAATCHRYANIEDDLISSLRSPPDGRFPDRPKDPLPPLMTSGGSPNVLVPLKWVLDNYDKPELETFTTVGPGRYMAFGGYNNADTSDRADSMGPAHRAAAFEYQTYADLDDKFFTDIFPTMFDTSDPDNFPAFVGSNHRSPFQRGPLKSDWTKACPMTWSQAKRDEECISLQECIYGTKLLRRLEAIKEAIDPNRIFDCHYCIGNVRSEAKKEEVVMGNDNYLVDLKMERKQ